MSVENKIEFIKKVMKIIDKWGLEFCPRCDPGTLASIDGLLDFKCIKCGKAMTDRDYLDEILKIVNEFREKFDPTNDKLGVEL